MTIRGAMLVASLSCIGTIGMPTISALAANPGASSPTRIEPTELRCAGTNGAVQSSGRAVTDGVFTARQASSGERTFRQVCSGCHETDELSGARWRLRWAGLSLGDIYATVSTSMPEDDPGSLLPEEYAEVLAYLLRLNDYPSGDQPLPVDVGVLDTIRIGEASRR